MCISGNDADAGRVTLAAAVKETLAWLWLYISKCGRLLVIHRKEQAKCSWEWSVWAAWART